MTRASQAWIGSALLVALLWGCEEPEVSYAGLDAPLDPAPILIGLSIDASGPRADAGRDLAHALRVTLAAEPHARGHAFTLIVYDDRSDPAGLRVSAQRFEKEHGVLLAVTGPLAPRGAALADAAARTLTLCAGCDEAGAPREASFALRPATGGASPTEVGIATAHWIGAALRNATGLRPSEVAAALRATPTPEGFARVEGNAPPLDPTMFRPPAAAAPKPR